ncbi:MAG: IPExxxVDY family protein, partial [Cytophagaceae bacterium]|nr:IPExxxVDY family protein [Cytophagaceae bacterium]
MKTSKLIVDYDYDFEILAIISSVKDYKLAWGLNKSLNINLSKSNDICLDFIKEGKLLISNFIFETEYTTFRLLKNKANDAPKGMSKPFLLPEL